MRITRCAGEACLVEAFLQWRLALVPGSQFQEAAGERVLLALSAGRGGQVVQQ